MSDMLKDLRGKLEAKRLTIKAVFEEAGPERDFSKVKSLDGADTTAKAEQLRQINEEANDLSDQIKSLLELDEMEAENAERGKVAQHPGHQVGPHVETKDGKLKPIGEQIVESIAFKNFKRGQGVGPVATLDVELKTLMETTAGWAPLVVREPGFLPIIMTQPKVIDVIPTTTTSQAAVSYMEETTLTDAATEVAEGGLYPEATFELTPASVPVQKIAVWIPVTDEQLEDVPEVSGYLNNRLPWLIRKRVSSQELNGDGTPPNLQGILNNIGLQSQAKGGLSVADAILTAMLAKVGVIGGGEANVIILNPLDWLPVRLERTTDGIYIWGSPSDAVAPRMWGLPVVISQELTANTGLVGDSTLTELAVKRGIDVQITNAHDDFFIYGKQAIRADMRAALVNRRPSLWCEVTGI